MPKNKKPNKIDNFLNKAEEELKRSGDEIARGVFQNLKANAQQSITQGILGALTGQQQPQAPPDIPQIPQQPPPPPFQKQPNPQVNLNIPGIRENLGWFYGGERGRPSPFTISAITDHFEYSDYITRLNAGEYWATYFRVVKIETGGNFSHAMEILIDPGDNSNESGWVWSFMDGKEEIRKASLKLNREYTDYEYSLDSYHPNEINELLLIHDGESIRLLLNRLEMRYSLTVEGEPKFIKTRVIGMGAVFWS